MKSLLALHEIDFPKVHDLELLADILSEKDIPTGLDIEILIELSDYAVEGRYAFIHEDIKEVDNYIKMLDKVLTNSGYDS